MLTLVSSQGTTGSGTGSGTPTGSGTTGSGTGSGTPTGSGTTGSGTGSGTPTGSGTTGSGTTDNTPCKVNFRKNPQGVCIPIEQCCKDDNCKPLYIANPTYKTRVKKIVIPYAVFRRYPYSKVKECPKGFKKINDRQCIHTIKTIGQCPLSYFRVNKKTCLKLVSIVSEKSDFWKIKCSKGQRKVNGKCVHISKKINIDLIQESKKKFYCPKGYKRVGKFKCIKVLLCPKGYKKTQTGCKRIKIQCPVGYKRVLNTCTKDVKCNKGFIKRKGKCVKFTRDLCRYRKCPRVECRRGFYKRHFKGTCCPQCVKCKCSKFFDPVCSTNGVTFRNKCDATCQGFKIKHKGTCNQPCNGKCPSFVKPVCGKDGKTYKNRCVLRTNLIDFSYNGRCKSRIVKDPKDKVKKVKKPVKPTKKYRIYLIKKELKICTIVQNFLAKKIKHINNRIIFAKSKKQTKYLKKLKSLYRHRTVQYNTVVSDCKNYMRITTVNRSVVYEMLSEKYRFKQRWLFNYKSLTKQLKHIKDKQLVKFSTRLKKCKAKSLKFQKRWNNYFQGRRRAQNEKINRAKSKSLKRFLKRSYKRYTALYKKRITKGLKRLNKRCKRILRRRNSFVKRFLRNLRKTSAIKKRVDKYRNLLKNKLTLSKRKFYERNLQKAEKRMTKFFQNVEKRSLLRKRRSCIRKYARAVRRVNNYKKRQLRIIKMQSERRLRADRRLKKFCNKFAKNKVSCYNKKKALKDSRRKAKDQKKDLKRKKIATKLKNRINKLKTRCDILHKKATPFLKSNKKQPTQFPKDKSNMTLVDCDKSHKTIVKMRRELRYNLRKKQLNDRLRRTKKVCQAVKGAYRNKRKSCKKNRKCILKTNKKLNRFTRLCSRRIRRNIRYIRENSRRYRRQLRIARRNQQRLRKIRAELKKARKSSQKLHGRRWIKYYLVLKRKILSKYNKLKLSSKKKALKIQIKKCQFRLKSRINTQKRRASREQGDLAHSHKLKLIKFKNFCTKKFGKKYKKCYLRLRANCTYKYLKKLNITKSRALKHSRKLNRQKRRCSRLQKRLNKLLKAKKTKKIIRKKGIKKNWDLKVIKNPKKFGIKKKAISNKKTGSKTKVSKTKVSKRKVSKRKTNAKRPNRRLRRPNRRFNGKRPNRRFNGRRPNRRYGRRPNRRFNGRRPQRRFNGRRPQRYFNGRRPNRRFGRRPNRRIQRRYGRRPNRRFNGRRPQRRFNGFPSRQRRVPVRMSNKRRRFGFLKNFHHRFFAHYQRRFRGLRRRW